MFSGEVFGITALVFGSHCMSQQNRRCACVCIRVRMPMGEYAGRHTSLSSARIRTVGKYPLGNPPVLSVLLGCALVCNVMWQIPYFEVLRRSHACLNNLLLQCWSKGVG